MSFSSDSLFCVQENVDGAEVVNGVSEPSPAGSPGASRKGKASQAATLPAKTQPDAPKPLLETFLHRKHEWEGHNKKASNRWGSPADTPGKK